jgi:uracil-DNA glycosylase
MSGSNKEKKILIVIKKKASVSKTETKKKYSSSEEEEEYSNNESPEQKSVRCEDVPVVKQKGLCLATLPKKKAVEIKTESESSSEEHEPEPEPEPEISDDITIYEVATQFCPPKWEDFMTPRRKMIKKISSLLEEREEAYSPGNQKVFRALRLTPPLTIRVVILGQDPYPNEGVATGLAFASNGPVPRSLANIYKEIASCIPGYKIPNHANLDHWAKQGVLLINTCLTCPIGNAGGHIINGHSIWSPFTSDLLKYIGAINKDCFYLLWGKTAQDYAEFIKGKSARILKAAHPSPMSANRGFFGCRHFAIVNKVLDPPIKW